MTLEEKFGAGKFVITADVLPPKGVNVSRALEEAALLRGRVDALNVADNPSAVMRMSSLGLAHLLAGRGIEPVLQMVCRDRNRLSLESELLSAAVLGLRNVLILTGDHQSLGDHPGAKGVFDLDSVQLLGAARRLMAGEDLGGGKLEGAPRFFLGAVVNPAQEPPDLQIAKLEKKVEAGARFIQTQPVYEPERFAQFLGRVRRLAVPIEMGVFVLRSAKMAVAMNEKVPGCQVPEHLIREIASAEKQSEAGIALAARLIRAARDLCQGVHVMSFNWPRGVLGALDGAAS
jgi:5,10-methylenetetrahydrofolate reductase